MLLLRLDRKEKAAEGQNLLSRQGTMLEDRGVNTFAVCAQVY